MPDQLPAYRGVARSALSLNGMRRQSPDLLARARRAQTAIREISKRAEERRAEGRAQLEAQADIAERAGSNRASFIRAGMENVEKDVLGAMREEIDNFAKNQLGPLQVAKAPLPDKRAMFATRGARAPQAMAAAMSAVSNMRKEELAQFAELMLAEIDETQNDTLNPGADISNEQAAFLFAIGQRAMALPREERHFSSAQFAEAAAVKMFDTSLSEMLETRKLLAQVEREAFDLRRNGKITAVTKMHGLGDKLRALQPEQRREEQEETPAASSLEKISRGLAARE